MDFEVEVREGTIEEAVEFSREIFDNPYSKEEYKRRFANARPIILIADLCGLPVGFKVGYDRYKDNSFYSWLGGVLPGFRRHGVATKLADRQETLARAQHYLTIKLKTKREFMTMFHFAKSRGFDVVKPFGRKPNYDHIYMEKIL